MQKVTFTEPVRVKCIHGNKRQFPIEGEFYDAVAIDVRGQLYFEGVFPDRKRMGFFEQEEETVKKSLHLASSNGAKKHHPAAAAA